MNNEYIILNKTLLADKILELKKEREEHEKVDIGMFDAIWAAKTTQAIDLLEEILSLSTPLIPEIEKAFDAGYDLNTWEQLEIPNEERDYLNEQDYISNLKLDI
jgi:hypothetical protein